jgi:predicted acylesterase/phospholipase RssA
MERLYAALRLVSGISSHELGLARSEPILNWMVKHMDPRTPLVMPLAWVATNLTTQSAEYFYRLPPSFAGKIPPRVERALRLTLGDNVILREASDAMLHRSLFASAAIPILFDPVVLPMIDGTNGSYVDGSIASNAIVTVARTVARNIHVVLVDAPSRRTTYANAIAVAVGGYSTMQREILAGALREVYLESSALRSFHLLALAKTIENKSDSADVRSFVRDLPIADIAYMRPERELPTDLIALQQQSQLNAAFSIGEHDAAKGFTPYVWETFRL